MKKRLLFVITQFYKGGAEVALLNLFKTLDPQSYQVDFLIFDQVPLTNAVSLKKEIPDWITVCDAAEKEGKAAMLSKVAYRVYRKMTGRQLYRKSAYQFVSGKHYDWAFSYGEWLSPQFVAQKVTATKKAVWIHTDIDKARVDERVLFGWDNAYQQYIFVSRQSKQSAENAYPLLRGRGTVIHNQCDDKKIWEMAQKEAPDFPKSSLPVLVTVANLRREKNHMRQVEAMRLLKEQGMDFIWINVGCAADPFLQLKLRQKIMEYELQDRFILLGARDNPYPYMLRSMAVCVLSDYESWSLVITEAKVLGIPVIATKTSGALEQLQDGVDGLLTDFTAVSIAQTIGHCLRNGQLREKLTSSLQGFSSQKRTITEWNALIGEPI